MTWQDGDIIIIIYLWGHNYSHWEVSAKWGFFYSWTVASKLFLLSFSTQTIVLPRCKINFILVKRLRIIETGECWIDKVSSLHSSSSSKEPILFQGKSLRHYFVTDTCLSQSLLCRVRVRTLYWMQRFLLFHFLLWSCFRSKENWMLNSLCSQYSFWITLQSPSSNKELENLYKNISTMLTSIGHFWYEVWPIYITT